MSVIVGIECRNGVVVAADTQIAENVREVEAWLKQTSRRKLREVLSLEQIKVVLGACGPAPLAEKLLSLCEDAIRRVERHPSFDDVVEACESSMARVQERWNQVAHRDSLSLLAGVHVHSSANPETHLVTVDSQGIASHADGYASIGNGKVYAQYILGRLWAEDVDTDVAALISVYCIHEVQRINPAVDGEPVVKVIGDGRIPSRSELIARARQFKEREREAVNGLVWAEGRVEIEETPHQSFVADDGNADS